MAPHGDLSMVSEHSAHVHFPNGSMNGANHQPSTEGVLRTGSAVGGAKGGMIARTDSMNSLKRSQSLKRAATWIREGFHGSKHIEIEEDEVEVLNSLGEGTSAHVYRAKFRGDDAAVKMLRVGFDRNSVFYKDFVKEIKVLAGLKHPNIVRLVGACTKKEPPFLLYEFLGGGTLEDYQIRMRESMGRPYVPPRAKIWKWSVDLMEGLNYLHTRMPVILHRDLKPANVLLTEDLETLKVADFGMVRPALSATEQARVLAEDEAFGTGEKKKKELTKVMTGLTGTLRYMAPEVYRSERVYNEKVDIYSAGLLVYCIATGDRPFNKAPDFTRIVQTVYNKDLRPPLEVVKWEHLEDLIQHMWDANPEQRPSSAEVLETLSRMPGGPGDMPPRPKSAPSCITGTLNTWKGIVRAISS
mmetsp:Transcript_34990/g.86041  ORF Transcript_34990/g.86041 Transcript_34990/m.86041 type:complete len:413 (+) Transcript_34990:140-1378(+)